MSKNRVGALKQRKNIHLSWCKVRGGQTQTVVWTNYINLQNTVVAKARWASLLGALLGKGPSFFASSLSASLVSFSFGTSFKRAAFTFSFS